MSERTYQTYSGKQCFQYDDSGYYSDGETAPPSSVKGNRLYLSLAGVRRAASLYPEENPARLFMRGAQIGEPEPVKNDYTSHLHASPDSPYIWPGFASRGDIVGTLDQL